MKTCTKCNETKDYSCFYNYKGVLGKLEARCKVCKNYQQIAWRAKNPNYTVEWNKKNPESRLTSRRNWRKNNPKFEINKYHSDPEFRLMSLMRTRLNIAIERGYKTGSAVRDLGMSIDAFLVYLNLDALDKYGIPYTGNEARLHIDHIIPLSSFDLTDRNQLLIACNWRNLQVLTATENLSKGARK